MKCEKCGLIYLNPRPTKEQLANYYPKDYLAHIPAIDDEPSLFLRLNRRYGLSRKCKAITARKRRGRLLDVGCGTGNFAHEMEKLGGWEVMGLDTSQSAAHYARKRFGLEVYVGELEEACFPDQHFDVVTLWDVIEHLPDPKGSLAEIARILRTDGLLVIGTPNGDSIDARLFGPFWSHWDAPRHFYLFSPHTLKQMLSQVGFQTHALRCFFGSWRSFSVSLQYLLHRKLGRRPPAPPPWDGLLRTQWLRLMVLPFYLLIDRLNRGALMTLFCGLSGMGPNRVLRTGSASPEIASSLRGEHFPGQETPPTNVGESPITQRRERRYR